MAAAPFPPLVFAPILFEKIWGGTRLPEVVGIAVPAGKRIGEAWVLSDREEARSQVRDGVFAGRTVGSLLEEDRHAILGRTRGSGPFPLLLKFLDAEGLLSVQVHPDDETARSDGEADRGKHEAWLFLRVGERAEVLAGLRPGLGVSEFERRLRSEEPDPGLRRLEVGPGDLLPIPAGTAHAIADAVFFEVQTNSDLTYRLSDWGRVGEDGRPRPTQLEKGLRALRPDSRPSPTRGRVELDPHFRMEFETGKALRAGSPDRATAVVPVEGEGILRWRGGSARWSPGEAWLLPAASGEVGFEASGPRGAWAVATPGEGGE